MNLYISVAYNASTLRIKFECYRMGPSHLGVYLCKAENEIGGDEGGVTLTGVFKLLSDLIIVHCRVINQLYLICQDVKIISQKERKLLICFSEDFFYVENQFTGEKLTFPL